MRWKKTPETGRKDPRTNALLPIEMTYEITGRTRLGCLLGTPVTHSLSPMMYNESFRLLGIDRVYLCFDTKNADLGALVQSLRQMDVFGFNLTMPDKERILPFLDEIDPAAQMIGAVNTVKNENGRLIGYNTDGVGYMRSVCEAGCDPSISEMTLLGAGGAAASIAVHAALDGIPALHIVNRHGRSWEKALCLAETITRNTNCRADVTDLADNAAVQDCLAKSRLLTNATSVGMSPNEDTTPIADSTWLHPDLLVSDIIYNPRQTRLLRDAAAQGCRTLNGLYMLLYQGAAAFRIWTGQDMPVEEVRKKYFQ